MPFDEKKTATESPFDFIIEQTLISAKRMSVWKLLFVCILFSEFLTLGMTALVSHLWMGYIPFEFIVVGAIDSFAVSLFICAGLVFMMVRLRESDNAYAKDRRRDEAILATIKDAICILDTSYRVLFQNEAHKFLNGSHLGKVCYEAYRGSREPCELCPVEMTIRDGSFHRVEKRVHTGAGLKYLDMSTSPILDENGAVKAVIEVIRDTTEYKRAVSAAKVGEEMFRNVSERLDAATWLSAGHGGRVIYVSPSFKDVWGRNLSEAYDDPRFLARYAHEDDRAAVKDALKKSAQGEQAEVDFRIEKPDGGTNRVKAYIIPLIDEVGEISRVIGVVRRMDRENSPETGA